MHRREGGERVCSQLHYSRCGDAAVIRLASLTTGCVPAKMDSNDFYTSKFQPAWFLAINQGKAELPKLSVTTKESLWQLWNMNSPAKSLLTRTLSALLFNTRPFNVGLAPVAPVVNMTFQRALSSVPAPVNTNVLLYYRCILHSASVGLFQSIWCVP